jgi:hypothetical protein
MNTRTHVIFDNQSLDDLLKGTNISENDIIFLEGDAQGDISKFTVKKENDTLIAKSVLDYEPELDTVNLEESQSKKSSVTKSKRKVITKPKIKKSQRKTRSMTKSKIKTRSMKKSKSKKKPTPP